MVQAIRGTVNGLLVVGFGEGLILGVAYALAGVPHPALFGLLTGLLSAVPFGAVLAYAAAAGLLAAGGDIGAAAWRRFATGRPMPALCCCSFCTGQS